MTQHARAAVFTVVMVGFWLGMGQIPMPSPEMESGFFAGEFAQRRLGMLGVAPFVSSFLMAELASVIVPGWRRQRFEVGFRARLRRGALWLGLGLAGIQGLSIGIGLQAMGALDAAGTTAGLCVLGAGVTMIAAEGIERMGLGSGFTVLWIVQTLRQIASSLGELPWLVELGHFVPAQVVAMLVVGGLTVLGTHHFLERGTVLGPGLPFRVPTSGLWPWSMAAALLPLLVLAELHLGDTMQLALMVAVALFWTPVASLIWHWRIRHQLWSQHRLAWVRGQVLSGAVLASLVFLDALLSQRWGAAGWPGLMSLVVLTALATALHQEWRARAQGLVLLEQVWDVPACLDAQARLGPGVVPVGLHYRVLTRIFGVLIPIRLFGEPRG